MTPWTVAHEAPLSMGFSRQEYWSGLPCPSLGYLPHPGIKPGSSHIAGRFFTIWTIMEAPFCYTKNNTLTPTWFKDTAFWSGVRHPILLLREAFPYSSIFIAVIPPCFLTIWHWHSSHQEGGDLCSLLESGWELMTTPTERGPQRWHLDFPGKTVKRIQLL